MRKRASMFLTAGGIIFSGAFLLLSINYANSMGLFYTKSSMPALFFANQMEAAVSGAYASPEEMTISYSGPNSCQWNEEHMEYECTGGGTIKGVGATIGFSQNQITVGIPFTGCIYIDVLMSWIGGKIMDKVGNKIEDILGSVKRRILKKFDDLRAWIRRGGKGAEQWTREVAEEASEEFTEQGIKEATDRAIKTFTGENSEEAIDSFSTALAKEQISAEDLPWKEWTSRVKARKKEIKELIKDSLSGKTGNSLYDDIIMSMAESRGAREAVQTMGKALDEYPSIYAKKVAAALEESAEQGSKEVIESGWIAMRDGFSSKTQALQTLKESTIRGMTQYVSCRSNNPLMDVVDLALNGQIILQGSARQVWVPNTYYLGKVGAISLKYNSGEEEMDINKLFAVNGEDMCFAREFIALNSTDQEQGYVPKDLGIVNGRVVLKKNKGLYDTICEETSEYYPIGVPEIAEYVLRACNQLSDGHSLEPIRVYSTPSRIITKQGPVICEERVKRDKTSKITGSFKTLCFNLSKLTDSNGNPCKIDKDANNDFYITIDYGRIITSLSTGLRQLFNKKISGTEYWFPETAKIDTKFSIDSPIASILRNLGLDIPELSAGFEDSYFPLLYELNDALQKIFGGRDKEFYFPSRYDYTLIEASKQGGKIYLTPVEGSSGKMINNVLGSNFGGVYTEDSSA